MKYLLAVLTHGDDSPLLATLESFRQNVSPAPSDYAIHGDGRDTQYQLREAGEALRTAYGASEHGWQLCTKRRAGFCKASQCLWTMAAEQDVTHVFWLEHDFVFTRPVNLEVVARVMASRNAFVKGRLAQMSFMRQPVNPIEVEHGGVVASLPAGTFTPEGMWLSHRAYFTTNPSLMPIRFMRDNPWPDHARECEGRFGIELRERGYEFGVWGDGDPWVEHVGVRTGKGY